MVKEAIGIDFDQEAIGIDVGQILFKYPRCSKNYEWIFPHIPKKLQGTFSGQRKIMPALVKNRSKFDLMKN